MKCYDKKTRNVESFGDKAGAPRIVGRTVEKNAKVISYPRSAKEIRARLKGRGLRTITEGKIITGGVRSLWGVEREE